MICTKVDKKKVIATWKRTCVGQDSFFWRRVAKWCWQRISTHVEQRDNCRTYAPTDSIYSGPQWGQLWSISIEILPRHSLSTIALWMTDQRNATLFCALALCQMVFHLGEVDGGILFCHLCGIGFLRAICLVIHFLPSLAK